jgi:subtilase family serine protease
VSNPPAVAKPGTGFAVTDTVTNQGLVASASSTTRYYISVDAAKDIADRLLTGTRSVSALAAGASSSGTVTVTIPATLPIGTYYLLACADDTSVVPETDETNNCIPSGTTVQVTLPDLVETGVSNPPAVAKPGTGFSVTDTVTNQGLVASASSTTRYYLSTDAVKDIADRLLTGTQSVSTLAAGASSSGTVTVTIPATLPIGTYYLIACADDKSTVPETGETNNCIASSFKVEVGP